MIRREVYFGFAVHFWVYRTYLHLSHFGFAIPTASAALHEFHGSLCTALLCISPTLIERQLV